MSEADFGLTGKSRIKTEANGIKAIDSGNPGSGNPGNGDLRPLSSTRDNRPAPGGPVSGQGPIK